MIHNSVLRTDKGAPRDPPSPVEHGPSVHPVLGAVAEEGITFLRIREPPIKGEDCKICLLYTSPSPRD